MDTTIIAICAICLVVAFLLDNKFEIPLGLTCMLAAFVICYLAFGMNANKVITSFFPGTIVLPLILAMAYFSVFTANGTANFIAKKMLSLIKGNMKLYPWTLFAMSAVMYTLLDGGALRYIIAPLVFTIAKAGGGSTLMSVSTAYLPFAIGSLNPYIGIDASTRAGILSDMGLENASNVNAVVWINSMILIVALQLFIYIVTGSWKVPNMEFTGNDQKAEITAEQKKSFIVLAATVAVFVLPPLLKALIPCELTNILASMLNNYTVFICGILAVILCGLSDWRGMLKTVSMKPIIMIVGVTFLIKTAQQAGLQELCTAVTAAVPKWLIPPVLLMIGAMLSLAVAAPTVQPMLFPMVVAMANTPAQAITYLTCITLGLAASGVSPISTSGVAFLSTVDLKDHDEYSKYMFIMAFLGPAVMAVLSATGILNVISGLFTGWYY